MGICVYKNCGLTEFKCPELKFARFVQPKSDLERAKTWIKLIGRDDFSVKDINYTSMLCEKHFKPNENLNWRINKSLEPLRYDFKIAVEDDDNFQNSVSRPKEPKFSYGAKVKTKIVNVPVMCGVAMESKNSLPIDFSPEGNVYR